MDLIQVLKAEHQIILGIFADVDATSGLEDKKVLFRKLMPIAVTHLNKEDTQLYPAFQRSPDAELRKMAEVFSSTMGGYAKELSEVVNEILTSHTGLSPALVTHYEGIRDRIKDRITIEETVLFPAYEELLVTQ